MNKVYVVKGEATSDGRNWFDWNIAAYTEKEQAEAHLAELNLWMINARESCKRPAYTYHDFEAYIEKHGRCPYDTPGSGLDYDTWYEIVEMPLFLHIDQYREEKGL